MTKNESAERLFFRRQEAKRMQQIAGWQPIETAPKDGRSVLIFVAGEVSLAHYSGSHWYDDEGMRADEYFEPTHWMTLPDPPNEVDKTGG
jgi:hypothetical protein